MSANDHFFTNDSNEICPQMGKKKSLYFTESIGKNMNRKLPPTLLVS